MNRLAGVWQANGRAGQGRLAGKAMAVRDAMKIVYSPSDGQDVSRAETDVFVKVTNLCVWIAKVPRCDRPQGPL